MKSLPLKLGIFIVLLFSLVILGMILFPEFRYRYWKSKLGSKDVNTADAAIEAFKNLPPGYRHRLYSEAFHKADDVAKRAVSVMAWDDSKHVEALGRKETLNLCRSVIMTGYRDEYGNEFIEVLKHSFAALRSDCTRTEFYDTWYQLCKLPDRNPDAKPTKIQTFVLGVTTHPFAAHVQAPDGRWFSEDGTRDGDLITTGVTMLAFLGMGHTHRGGRFRENVKKSTEFLKKIIKDDGRFSDDTTVQAICTAALGELYAITNDQKIRNTVHDATADLVRRILPDGGFPKNAGEKEPDVAATCWSVIALKPVTAGGIEGPFEVNGKSVKTNELLKRIAEYIRNSLKTETDPDKCAPLVIAGIFCRMKRDDPAFANAWKILIENLPEKSTNITCEYLYFASYSEFQLNVGRRYYKSSFRTDDWKKWSDSLKKHLIGSQLKEPAYLEGTWEPDAGPLSRRYGRIYTTAMNALSLEIYYRFKRAHIGK